MEELMSSRVPCRPAARRGTLQRRHSARWWTSGASSHTISTGCTALPSMYMKEGTRTRCISFSCCCAMAPSSPHRNRGSGGLLLLHRCLGGSTLEQKRWRRGEEEALMQQQHGRSVAGQEGSG